jgi:hypothetical protein
VTTQWLLLSKGDQEVFRIFLSFLDARLCERATLEWALKLGKHEVAKRLAVREILGRVSSRTLSEPWASAWRLIEEGWKNERVVPEEFAKFQIADRLQHGERSSALIDEVVDLVRPMIKVSQRSKLSLFYRPLARHPANPRDLMSVELSSGELINPREISLQLVDDVDFLIDLANELEAAVNRGLNLGRRLLDASDRQYWRYGTLRRVYLVRKSDGSDFEDEPDRFNTGIAPAVKLLHSVLSHLGSLDQSTLGQMVGRWKGATNFVWLRLWAAFARDTKLASPQDVASLLLRADDGVFWDLHEYPEVAELRAVRFSSLSLGDQRGVIHRIRKLPPAKQWPRKSNRTQVQRARRYSAARELRRVEVAGFVLHESDRAWLDEYLAEFDELRGMDSVDDGFPSASTVHSILPSPDERYDFLIGTARLQALESALSSKGHGWEDDPGRSAADWMGVEGNLTKVLADFEAAKEAGQEFPQVWERFAWRHSPSADGNDAQASSQTADRVASLVPALSIVGTALAIRGLSRWLDVWAGKIATDSIFVRAWLHLWPAAVQATNAEQPADEELSLNAVVRGADEDEPRDLDVLNTPVGWLVGAFLSRCPGLDAHPKPFDDVNLARMRNEVVAAPGRAGLVAQHRLVEHLAYFLRADPGWAGDALVEPLRENTNRALMLWRAVARRTRYREVIEIIGEMMADRATEARLGRTARRSLAFSLVVEMLYSFKEGRAPAVSLPKVQQMLRALDDEVRAYAANAVQSFIRDISDKQTSLEDALSPETVFTSAARPFLELVWPQERSLATPGVARSFADLPAESREQFVAAVDSISRFLVPFDCWSLSDFGFHGSSGDETKLAAVDSTEKASALLQLLDLTIATTEGAVAPTDLGIALGKISALSPKLAESTAFRRLATVARK